MAETHDTGIPPAHRVIADCEVLAVVFADGGRSLRLELAVSSPRGRYAYPQMLLGKQVVLAEPAAATAAELEGRDG